MLKQHFSITLTFRMDEVLAGGQDRFDYISNFGKIYFLLNEAFVTLYEVENKKCFTFIYANIIMSCRQNCLFKKQKHLYIRYKQNNGVQVRNGQ